MSAEDIARYLDGTLSGDDRARVESVLASSPEARAEIVEASRLLSTLPQNSQGTRRRWAIASVGAAAAVLLFALSTTVSRNPAPLHDTERQALTNDSPEIRVIAPSDGAQLDASAARFVWNSFDGASYQFTLTDAQGRVLWQASISDTTVALPETKTIAGETYYWNVDALAADGSSLTTGLRAFTIRRR